jgi:hypothetical protein
MDVLFPPMCKFNKCNFWTQISLIKLPKTFLTLQKFQNVSRAAPIKVSLARKFLSTLPCHVEPGLKFFHQVLIKLAITLQENFFSDQQIIETLPTFSFG